jgi:glycosyltransferase involved in cell wall biosynthesis
VKGPLRADVEREIHDLGLQSVVHLAGYRTDADELLAAADVATLSSREEGWAPSCSTLWHLASLSPATRAGGIPEVIVNGESGLLAERENPTALGDAIASILLDAALAARLRDNAPVRAKEFSVERMADRTVGVYERVAG